MAGKKKKQEGLLSPGEKRNGWTEESLAKYLREREGAAGRVVGIAERGPTLAPYEIKIQNSENFDPNNW